MSCENVILLYYKFFLGTQFLAVSEWSQSISSKNYDRKMTDSFRTPLMFISSLAEKITELDRAFIFAYYK
jgi:hypothetical protein